MGDVAAMGILTSDCVASSIGSALDRASPGAGESHRRTASARDGSPSIATWMAKGPARVCAGSAASDQETRPDSWDD